MINLLPQSARRRIVIEYWVRVVSVWFFAISLVCSLVALLLMPTFVLVFGQANAYREGAAEAAEELAAFDLSSAELQEANRSAATLVREYKLQTFSMLLEEIDSTADEAIRITEYTGQRTDEGNIESIKINGLADSRQSLAAFRDRLEALTEVASVDLPLSNLAKDSNIPFSLAIGLNTESL